MFIGHFALGFAGLVVVLLAIYCANLLGEPPRDQRVIAVADLFMWLFVLWAWWVDGHRPARAEGIT
jgi:hypothetical protein